MKRRQTKKALPCMFSFSSLCCCSCCSVVAVREWWGRTKNIVRQRGTAASRVGKAPNQLAVATEFFTRTLAKCVPRIAGKAIIRDNASYEKLYARVISQLWRHDINDLSASTSSRCRYRFAWRGKGLPAAPTARLVLWTARANRK